MFRSGTRLGMLLGLLVLAMFGVTRPLNVLAQQMLPRDVMLTRDASASQFVDPEVAGFPILSCGTGTAPSPRETSEFMMGSVAVGLVFVESDGTIDANTHTWTAAEMTAIRSKVSEALNFWEGLEPKAHLSFQVYDYGLVSTRYEPTTRTIAESSTTWIRDVTAALGYSVVGASAEFEVRGLAQDLRVAEGTDWAFIMFAVDGANTFWRTLSGGAAAAYAVLGGPYLVFPDDPAVWGTARVDKVIAHETAHIFWATDEYDEAPAEFSGYLGAADNDGAFSLMAAEDTWTVSSGTRLQIGWRDTDGDGIMDILDTGPRATLVTKPNDLTDSARPTYAGTVTETPLENRNPHSFGCQQATTLNKITSVTYRVDGGAWRNATSVDGSFDSSHEGFTFQPSAMATGAHTVEVRGVNSQGNGAAQTMSHSFTLTHLVIASTVSRPIAAVGSSQRLSVWATWAHDGQPVTSGFVKIGATEAPLNLQGQALFTVTSAALGMQSWAVTSATSSGVAAFVQSSPLASITWDRILVVSVAADRQRINVGEFTTVLVKARLEYSGTVLGPTDRIMVSGLPALYDPSRQGFTVQVSSGSIGTGHYDVTEAEHVASGLGLFRDPLSGTTVGWDLVLVEVSSSRSMVDVGMAAPLQASGVYALDGMPFEGAIQLSQAATQTAVGTLTIEAVSVKDEKYGLTAFQSNRTSVGWDRVDLLLSVKRPRVDLGDEAELSVVGTYAIDGTPFMGSYTLDGRLAQNAVGRRGLRVASIEDPQYGLTVFQSNEAAVIWDVVLVHVAAPVNRVQTGSDSTVTVNASYAYDGAPFLGDILLNRDLASNTVGRVQFMAVMVTDSAFGLQGFQTNDVEVLFDQLQSRVAIHTLVPGKARVTVRLTYASDGAPVDANVSIGNVAASVVAPGAYSSTSSTWSPRPRAQIDLHVDGFRPQVVEASAIAAGTSASYGIILVTLVGGAGLSLAKLRRP